MSPLLQRYKREAESEAITTPTGAFLPQGTVLGGWALMQEPFTAKGVWNLLWTQGPEGERRERAKSGKELNTETGWRKLSGEGRAASSRKPTREPLSRWLGDGPGMKGLNRPLETVCFTIIVGSTFKYIHIKRCLFYLPLHFIKNCPQSLQMHL